MSQPASTGRTGSSGSPAAPIVALVADDLTGSTDTAVQFAAAGWDARLLLDPAASSGAASGAHTQNSGMLFAATTDARAFGHDEARAATGQMVRRLNALGADRLYLKIDSTVRGSVAGQIDGALDALGPEHLALLCPAYPLMGRTVDGAALLVDGVPVAETGLRDDPATPVTQSDLRALVPGSVPLDAAPGDVAALTAALERALQAARSGGPRVVIAEATAEHHLDDLARAVAHLGRTAPAGTGIVPVGSAGLAAALARAWAAGEHGGGEPDVGANHAVAAGTVAAGPSGPDTGETGADAAGPDANDMAADVAGPDAPGTGEPDPHEAGPDEPGAGETGADAAGTPPRALGAAGPSRLLVQVSSLNAVSRRQLAVLQDAWSGRALVLTPEAETLIRGEAEAVAWLEDQLSPWVRDGDGWHTLPELVLLSAPEERAATADAARTVAACLGGLTARLLGSGVFGGAGLVGGDGARAALAALGTSTVRVLDQLEEGTPLSMTLDGQARHLPLFTKAGGFGKPESLTTTVARMRALLQEDA